MAILINMSSRRRRLVEDENLSLKAIAVLFYLCSKKKVSEFIVREIDRKYKDSRPAVMAAMTALENARYLHKFGDQNSKTYIVFDSPITLSKQTMGLLKQSNLRYDFNTRDKLLVYGTLLIYYNTINTIITSVDIDKKNIIKKEDYRGYDFQPPSYEEKEIQVLINWWKENIINHKRGSKTYEKSLTVLTRKYDSLNKKSNGNHLEIRRRKSKGLEIKRRKRSKGFETIMAAFRVYGEMVNDEKCFAAKKSPWVIGLDQFFGFKGYTKNKVLPKFHKRGLDSIGSWYSECVLGREYCYNTWAGWLEVLNPYLIEVLNSHFFPGRDFEKVDVEDHNLMVKVAREFSRFYEENKSKIQTPNKLDERYEARFAKYLFKFIDHKFTTKPFKLHYMLNKRFLDQEFKEYLLEMGWMKRR